MFDWSYVEGHHPSVEKKKKQNKKEQQVDKQLWALSFVPRGVLWISSDRDDQRIFLGGTIWQVFLRYSKQSRFVVVPAHIPANKVQPNLFCSLEIFKFWKFGMGFIGGLILGPGIFFLILIFAPFDHPCHLKSGVSPWFFRIVQNGSIKKQK